jgi:hypothetical protein
MSRNFAVHHATGKGTHRREPSASRGTSSGKKFKLTPEFDGHRARLLSQTPACYNFGNWPKRTPVNGGDVVLRSNSRKWDRRTWLIVAVLLLVAGSLGAGIVLQTSGPPHVPVPPPIAAQFAGTYYQGDGLGVQIHLTLAADGSFTGTWDGCMGRYGDSDGNWSVSGKSLSLSPHRETEMMKNYARTFDIVKTDKGFVFVAEKDRRHFKEYGDATADWCFHRVDQLNQRSHSVPNP